MKRTFWILSLVIAATTFSFGQYESVQREAFLSGFSSPIHITNAGDGSNRLFIVEQRGLIKVVPSGSTTATTYFDLTGRVSQSGNERGLLGLAFHPDYQKNGFFFVNYTRSSDGATVIDRYRDPAIGNFGETFERLEIIVIGQDFSNHNGGHIEFGPDNNLYIGMGDGGSGNDPNDRAQDINSLLGKMLRITPSLEPLPLTGTVNYDIPNDNPFVGVPGRDEIFATGLRNPYRWSFDQGGDRKLWAGDVGQFSIEEVTIVENGGNYGWRVFEGNSCTNNDPNDCTASNFDPPVLTYDHGGGRCSITGGYVYRGTAGTLRSGDYIYGDFCSGEYYVWDGSQSIRIENSPRNISSFGQDEQGELYLVHIGGTVEKLINTEPFVSSPAASDFDGDGRTDVSVFRPSTGVWYSILSSNSGFAIAQFGADGDIPVPNDYDADGLTDRAVFRPSTGTWFIFQSGDNTVDERQFGIAGDIPTPGDFILDDKPELAFFRPSEGTWYIVDTPGGDGSGGFTSFQFGLNGDVPIVGDYDGNGKDDLAVFRPSDGTWYSINADTTAFRSARWGLATDIPAPGDFDGDGTTDLNVYRPDEGNWYTLFSSTGGFQVFKWGIAEDLPNPGDYDGDGSDDIAIWRPSTSEWYVFRSTDQSFFAFPFGLSDDIPIPQMDSR